MELKKPNQISIKLNGSTVQSNQGESKSNNKSTASPSYKTKTTMTTIPTTQQFNSATEITTLQETPYRKEEFLSQREELEQTETFIEEEDALSRLNQLRYQSEAKQQPLEYVESNSETNRDFDFEQYMDGPIVDLEGHADREDATWYDRLRTNRSGFRKGLKGSVPPIMQTGWFRMLASTVGAVALGLLFGFTVLMVFKEEQLSQSYKTVLGETLQIPGPTKQTTDTLAPSTGTVGSVPANSQSETTQQQLNPEEMIQSVVSVPEQSFYLAQAGVFSDRTSAEPAIEPLQKQGFPHFLYEIEEKQHLFVATAPTRDEILGIASFLKNSKMEVYIKELAFPSLEIEMKLPQSLVAADPSAPDSNKVEAFFANGFELTRSLSAYSSKVLNQGGNQQPISAEEENKLRDLHRRFLDEGRAIQAGIPQEWQPLFKNMIDGLNQAVTAMTGLKTQNATPYAWQVQNGVFQFVENYVSWSKSTKQ